MFLQTCFIIKTNGNVGPGCAAAANKAQTAAHQNTSKHCRSHSINTSLPLLKQTLFVSLRRFSTEEAEIRRSAPPTLMRFCRDSMLQENRGSLLFQRCCCRPKYGLLLPFPRPPGGADVTRRGLNIVYPVQMFVRGGVQ